MSVEEIDKDALETLTPEERAAIEDTEFSPEELAAMKAVAGDDDPDDEDDAGGADDADADSAGDGAGKKAGDDSPEGKGTEVEPSAADSKKTDADDEPLAPEFAPKYSAELPADYDEKVAALKNDTRELAKQFKDGDIDFDEYSEKLDALNARRDELAEIRVKASIASEMGEQTEAQRWQHTIEKFASRVLKEEKIDYIKDPERQAELDAFVKALAANPKNAEKSYDWFLSEAHRRVKALNGIGDTPPAKEVKTEESKPEQKTERKPPVSSAPKTLAQVPGSDGAGDVGGEFADIDALEGLELEQALKAMTPAQRERYQRGE